MHPLIKEHVDITSLTTFGIKTSTRYFAEYSSVDELEQIMRTPEYQQSEVFHIGGGSNLVFVNDYTGFILHSTIKGIKSYRKDDTTTYVIAGAGEKWTDLVDFCVTNGLGGLENLAHIPGEVGASAVQNVGAYGVEASDLIHTVECYDRLSHKVVNFKRDECGYGYRESMFKKETLGRYYILRVSYRLRNSSKAEHLEYGPLKSLAERLGHQPTIKEVRDEIISIRRSKLPDPAETGSAGSFFTNPVVSRKYYEEFLLPLTPDMPHYDIDGNPDRVKIPAGWLIEQAGLKGMTVGGAYVYPKQSLVIANRGDATGADVCKLAYRVREEVFRQFNILLRREAMYVDNSVYVTVLGSGTSKGVPEIGCSCKVCTSKDEHDRRLRASILVKTHGVNILIDSSPDFRYQALREKIRYIDAVLLTHSHYDHVGGIDDLRPYCIYGDLPIYLRKDVENDLRRRIDYCFRENLYPGVPTFRLNQIANDPFFIKDVKVIPISVNHARLPIVGYRIGNFAFITDAKTIPEEEFAKLKGIDTIIVNALRWKEHFSHFNVDEVLKFIERVKPRRAYLTHMCHEIGLHDEVNSKLPDNVRLAYDGLRIEVD